MINSNAYYEKHAEQFFQETVGVDMGPLYERFLAYVPVGAVILDAGCGSGRDALGFKKRGYPVHAFDASEALALKASELLDQPVARQSFEQFDEAARYGGIWACASLLHLPEKILPEAFERLWNALLPGGVLYCSFKFGDGERVKDGRHFTDANKDRVQQWTQHLHDCETKQFWMTEDQRPGRAQRWLNILLFKAAVK